MGQGGSKVTVHVQLDAGYYYAGETVTGAVVVHTEQPMTVKSISVKVTGVEKSTWVEKQHSSTPSHDVTYRGKNVIFKHKLPLTVAGTIQPGGYQWPISFQLPPNIPGTFHHTAADNRAKASIEYKVKALVDQEGMFKTDFKKTLRFDVLQRTKAPSGPLMLDTDTPISAWCCINKGHVGMRVCTATDSYLPGDSISIDAQVDNKSITPITLVEMKLHQRLHLNGSSFMGTINKYIDVVRAVSRQQPVNGTQGGGGLVSHYTGRLDLDRNTEATCLGKVVRSTYELEVRAKTGCCLSEVVIKHPIFVNDPQPQGAPAPLMQPPLGWAPQVYPAVAFEVPAPDGYTAWQQQQQQYHQPPVQATAAAAAAEGAPVMSQPLQYGQQPNQPSFQYNQPEQQYAQCGAPEQQYTQQQYTQQQYPQQQHQQPGQYSSPAPYVDTAAGGVTVPGAVCYVGQQQQQYSKGAHGQYNAQYSGQYNGAVMATGPALSLAQWGSAAVPDASAGVAPCSPTWGQPTY